MKKLNEIIDCNLELNINGITDDSRLVKNGYIFVATKGFNVDHYDYIQDAINNGAVFLVVDREINFTFPHIIIENINDKYLDLCSKFYNVDLDDFSFIGITGTDGKTTTTTIIKKLLNKLNSATYIGTNGAEINNLKVHVSNTTPCVSELYSVLEKSKNNNSTDIVMEVSSEALLHDRVKKFKFKIVGFTNITEDHLNVHKNIENYIECKKKLLNYLEKYSVVIVNGDDKVCKTIESDNILRFGFDNSNDCVISNVKKYKNKTTFTIKYLENTYKINSPYEGDYNIYNVTMAFLVCLHYGLAPEYLIDEIANLEVVSGRREKLNFGQNYEIILDYAHTLNGIKNVIDSVDKGKNIIVLTGCAGGREKEKRRNIGKYILENCNIAIFTMDDPRYESVDKIIDEMVVDTKQEYLRILDRKDAIFKALSLAKKDSVVLILGKGRDDYMAIEDKKIPYSDYNVIASYFDN